jgi:FAD/FMN-containing dehydrogenase
MAATEPSFRRMTVLPRYVPSAVLDRFVGIVGAANVVRADEDFSAYVTEPRGLWTGRPAMVLKPGSTAEVSAILKLAAETHTVIVPYGGGTGLVGGQIADDSGSQVVVAMGRMNRIREIDLQSNTVTVEAGVVLQTLRDVADENDRLFPLSLGSQGSCQIGGNLSSNAGGTGVLAYGNARELCLGVEVVLPGGDVLDDLRKLKKDNTGYDLKNLFIGAEGTLGIVTAAVMKLVPRPKGREVAWAGVPSPRAALDLFGRATELAGTGLTAFELCIDRSVDFTLRHIPGITAPLPTPHPWYVLMEISSGRSAEDARELMEKVLGDGIEAGIVADAVIAQNLVQADAFWKLREMMSDGQKPEGGSIKHDISVPVASIPDFIVEGEKAALRVSPGARLVCFGHMGDGNLHFNVSQPVGAEKAEFLALYRPMNDAVHDVVRAFGGSISAEHGIGQLKRYELLATAPPVAIDLMWRIRKAFDPAAIMNPGKVI